MRLAMLVLLLTAAPAFATSYARPKRHDVLSPNGAFVLDVRPDTKVHTVYAFRDRSKPLWSFSCTVWHFPFLVSDDGRVVATVAWEHIPVQAIVGAKAVRFRNKDGEFRSHLLRDLCPDPPKTKEVGRGPIGDFWRTWYTKVQNDGDTFTIRTTCETEYRFRYADGELVGSRPVGWRGLRPWVLAVGSALGLVSVAVAFWCCRRGRQTIGRCDTERHGLKPPDQPLPPTAPEPRPS
jgi:hypothetical protein